MHKNSNKSGSSNTFTRDNDEQGGSQNNSKGLKSCSNCGATDHNIRRCVALCKSCGKEGHTYVKCKGKHVEDSNSN
jgi:hypothetical protein